MIRTCARCHNMKINDLFGTLVAYCEQTDLVVPQNSTNDRGEICKITFFRIPLSCPRNDVIKTLELDAEPGNFEVKTCKELKEEGYV